MKSSKPFLTALVFSALAFGCGSNDSAPPEPIQSTAEPMDPEQALIARGRSVFRQCTQCHFGSANGKHGVGPNLFDVAGNPAGRYDDFRYSAALRRSGIVWDDETLDRYLERPQAVIPGGRMSYAGMKNPEDRCAVIAYLNTLTAPDAGSDQ